VLHAQSRFSVSDLVRLLYSSTCFEHYTLIIRMLNCIVSASGIVTVSQWPSGAQVERELDVSQLVHVTYNVKLRCVPTTTVAVENQ
jgi:hypothetical protein